MLRQRYAIMDYSTEGRRSMASLQEMRRSLEEWDIGERICEKIEIWGVRHSSRKVAAIPIDFISAAILYYIVHRTRSSIANYSQTLLMSLGHRLKLIYNSLALAEFKNTSFFEFSLVLLAKLTHYFITSRLPELAKGDREGEIESDLYRTIVGLLIGYEVDSKAFELTEKKYKQKRKNSLERKDSCKGSNDFKLNIDPPEKAKRTTTKLHRNGIRNLLQNNEEQKNLETFRLQVHEALHVRKGGERSEHKFEPRKRVAEEGRADEKGWLKGKNKLLNVNQVSAAFSIYMGADAHKKAAGNIHLSKRRRVKEYFFGLHRGEREREQVTMPLAEMSLNSTKDKDWSLIVESLKQRSQHMTRQVSPAMKKYHLCHQSQANIGAGAKFNQLTLKATEDRSEEGEEVDFRRICNAEDKSIHCVSSVHSTQKETLRESSSTFFVRDRGQFERSCAKRRQIFQTSSIYLPRLEKQ